MARTGADASAEQTAVIVAVDDLRIDGGSGPGVVAVDASGFRRADASHPSSGRAPVARLSGTLLPPLVDAHVHLGLVDPAALVPGGIGGVVDLGSDPALVGALARHASDGAALPSIQFAGRFLTAPGGYPTGRAWADPASIDEIADPAAAVRAVDRMHAMGADRVKVALNADAGPVLDDVLLAAVVDRAARHGMVVIAHAQGAGQVERALAAGVGALAHTPWTERPGDALVAALAARMTWVSTIDIHGYGASTAADHRARDNLTRFVAAGGEVRYGTDLGNGPLPVGLNPRELDAVAHALAAAGQNGAALVRAVTGRPPATPVRTPGFVPDDPLPAPPDAAASWLARSHVLTPDHLEEHLS